MELQISFLSGARAGTSESFHKLPLTLGRAATCDVLFHAEQDAQVSSVHAEVRRGADGLEVRDAGSTNGTWVGGVRLEGAAPLSSGMVLRLGERGPKIRIDLEETGGISFAELQRQTARRKRQGEQRIVSTIEATTPLRARGHEPGEPLRRSGAPRVLLVVLGLAVVLIAAIAGFFAFR